MRAILLMGLFVAALTLRANDAADKAPTITTVIVPVVGNVLGENEVRWKTDIELRNNVGEEIIVALEPAGFEDRTIVETIEPGGVRRYTDVIQQAFGMDSALVPLIVRTAGRRPVTIRATVYGVRGAETFPQLPIPISYSSPLSQARILSGLSFTSDHRTNVGISNLGGRLAHIVLGLQRLPGRTLAVSRIDVPPGTLHQVSIQTLFPLITKGSDFAIVIETSAPNIYVYASVVENATNFARFIEPAATHSLAFQRRGR